MATNIKILRSGHPGAMTHAFCFHLRFLAPNCIFAESNIITEKWMSSSLANAVLRPHNEQNGIMKGVAHCGYIMIAELLVFPTKNYCVTIGSWIATF